MSVLTAMIQRLRPTHTGPDALTKAILVEVGDDCVQMRSLLEETLPTYCRRAIGFSRRNAAKQDTPIPAPASKAKGTSKQDTPTPAPASKSKGTSRQDRIRSWWKTQLDQDFNVTGKGYIKLGKLTYDDLQLSAEARHAQAAGNIAWAKRLEALADALKRYQVTRVEQLPEAVFIEIWDQRS